jgi:gluconate 2-dehydrogenase gamma chain
MDRRKSIKALAIGTVGAAALLTGCKEERSAKPMDPPSGIAGDEPYGRTPKESEHDAALIKEQFFTSEEMETITVLCDIIIPADQYSGSASDAQVPAFIEFIVKDMPDYQTPLRGGLKWLDMKSYRLCGKPFAKAPKEKQIELVELIAYPEKVLPANRAGANFFSTLRNLTATGFFTSKVGIEDLGYKGNVPNAWDGVPADVLQQFGLEYDQQTLDVCLKIEDRGKIMTWE